MIDTYGDCAKLWPTLTADNPFYGGRCDLLGFSLPFVSSWPEGTVTSEVSRLIPTARKADLAKFADMIYNTYLAVVNEGFPLYNSDNPATVSTAKEVQKRTGIMFLYVHTYLKALYTLAKTGKIDTKYWNPVQGKKIEAAKSKETAALFAPLTSFYGATLNKVLVLAAIGATAYFVLPRLLKTKLTTRK